MRRPLLFACAMLAAAAPSDANRCVETLMRATADENITVGGGEANGCEFSVGRGAGPSQPQVPLPPKGTDPTPPTSPTSPSVPSIPGLPSVPTVPVSPPAPSIPSVPPTGGPIPTPGPAPTGPGAGSPTGAGPGPGAPSGGRTPPGGTPVLGGGEGMPPGAPGASAPAPSDRQMIGEGERQASRARESATDAIRRALDSLRTSLSDKPAPARDLPPLGRQGAGGREDALAGGQGGAGPRPVEASVVALPSLGRGVSLNGAGRPLASGAADPRSASDHSRETARKLAAGDLEGAVDAASRALALEPGDARSLARRSEAYNRLKKYDLAHADAVGALGRDRANVRALQNKAWSEFKRGDTARALATLDQAASLAATDPTNALIRAYIKDQSGDRAGALEDLRRAARLDPSLAEALADYEAGGQILDPFDRTTLSVKTSAGRRRGRAFGPTELGWGLAALALLALVAWIAVRRARTGRFFHGGTRTYADAP